MAGKKQVNVGEPENAGAVAGPPEASGAAAPDGISAGVPAGEAGNATQTQEAAAPAVYDSANPAHINDSAGSVAAASEGSSNGAAVESEENDPPPDRQLAAEMVTRFLGHQGSKARDEVSDLNDAEAWEVIRAAGDRFTARAQMKSIIGRAYDRRREEAHKAAGEQQAAAELASRAQAVIEKRDGVSAEDAAAAVAKLKPEEVAELLAKAS